MVVTGAEGQVGREIVLMGRKRKLAVVALSRGELDIGDPDSVSAVIASTTPDVVVNCAAFTDVDRSETDRVQAERGNRDGPAHVASAAAASGALIVHLSTDFVFDGKSAHPYSEEAEPNPISYYGRTKLEGERLVMATAGKHIVVRTSWVYGHGRRNFVTAIATQALELKPIRVVSDQAGSPTYARDLAAAIFSLIEAGARGMVNFGNAGECTRHEYASEIVRLLGCAGAVEVEPIVSESLKQPAKRPAYSVLDCTRYRRLTGLEPRPWQSALLDYLIQEFPERFAAAAAAAR